MGKVIVVSILLVVLAIIIALVATYFRRKEGQEKAKEKGWATKGDLTAAQERAILSANDSAAEIFRSLLVPSSNLDIHDDVTLLANTHRTKIEEWLKSTSSKRRG